MGKIENEFGKKIGGSRRDQWNPAGIDLNDLSSMNDAEQAEFIKKDNVWPKPDYQKMKDDGIMIEAVYFIKTVRDSIAPKPVFANAAKELYVEAVSKIRDKAMAVRTADDISGFKSVVLDDPYFVPDRTSRYFVKPSVAFSNIGASKVLHAVQTNASRLGYEIRKKKFLYSEEKKALIELSPVIIRTTGNPDQFEKPYSDRNKGCMVKNGSGSYFYEGLLLDDARSLPEGRYLLRVNTCTYAGEFGSKDEALEFAQNLANALMAAVPVKKKATKKQTFCYQRLENLVQSGQDATPQGISGNDYIDGFGFYGGEFGNWLNQDERQKNLDMCYVSFLNLAKALDMENTGVSLGGKLSIAFGARGKGNALAHFEPLRSVINLTKLRGAGSLAHEYGHAIDFIIGKEMLDGRSFAERYDSYSGRAKLRNICPEAYDLLSAMFYNENGRYTAYYEESKKMAACYSKQGGYWDSAVEMFARAFACYIKDKLDVLGIRDDYLCGHADCCVGFDENGTVIKAYPVGDERIRLNGLFDKFFNALLIKKVSKAIA